MTDQLRDVMTRMAERVDPAPVDPDLWSRAGRARRRRDLVVASSVGAAVFAVTAGLGILVTPDRDAPAPDPARRPGIPTVIHGVFGDGSLPLETDLAVGTASVAVANPTDAFVVTADDGVFHRLDLPGFDAHAYDDPEVRRTGMVGLSLSPDGTRLAYGWHAPLPDSTGQTEGFVRGGLRILDLETGSVEDVPEDRLPPAEFGAAVDGQGFPWTRIPYGARWSPGGRYLSYELVWAAVPARGVAVAHWGRSLRAAYHQKASASGVSVYDTETGRRHDVRENRFDPASGFWLSGLWAQDGWPTMVGDDGTVAKVSVNNAVDVASLGGRVTSAGQLPGGPGNDDHAAGILDDRGHALVEARGRSTSLVSVDLTSGGPQRLELPLTPVVVDLLGWIGPDHALAQVKDGTEQNLIVFDLSDTEVESDLVAPFDDEGTESSFSFATGLATVRHPVTDFITRTPEPDRSTAASTATPPDTDRTNMPHPAWFVGGLGAALLAAGLVWGARRQRDGGA